jgi:hypothetical protein
MMLMRCLLRMLVEAAEEVILRVGEEIGFRQA